MKMKIKSQIKKNRIDEDLSKSTVIDSKNWELSR